MDTRQGAPIKAPQSLEAYLRQGAFVGFLILGALFVAFFVYYTSAPWEISYREHSSVVLRAQIEALPPYNGDEVQRISVSSLTRGPSVLAEYSRHEPCVTALDYYRQLVPTHGWTYTKTEKQSTYTSEHHSGVFEGYHVDLAVSCDPSYFAYDLDANGPYLCLWSCPPAPQEAVTPHAPQ
jgi:hypothetical protein